MCRVLAFSCGPELPPARAVGPATATDVFRRVAHNALPINGSDNLFYPVGHRSIPIANLV